MILKSETENLLTNSVINKLDTKALFVAVTEKPYFQSAALVLTLGEIHDTLSGIVGNENVPATVNELLNCFVKHDARIKDFPYIEVFFTAAECAVACDEYFEQGNLMDNQNCFEYIKVETFGNILFHFEHHMP